MRRFLLFSLLLPLVLASCQLSGDETPPTVAILSPAAGSPVSGTTTVQLSADDDHGVASVKLFVRARGSQGQGVQLGSATQAPYVVSWYTLAQPNLAELELVAVATDFAGNEGRSEPVAVRVQNAGVPSLQLLTAFTLPPNPALASLARLGAAAAALPTTPTTGALPPTEAAVPSLVLSPQSSALAAGRSTVLEWQWEAFPAGADGYGVYLSSEDLAGPYALQVRQAAAAGAGVQKHSRLIEGAKVGDTFHGVVTAITDGASSESGFSDADGATFLPSQSATSPLDGATVASGRPTLSWTATPGALGYLYYLRPQSLGSGGDLAVEQLPALDRRALGRLSCGTRSPHSRQLLVVGGGGELRPRGQGRRV